MPPVPARHSGIEAVFFSTNFAFQFLTRFLRGLSPDPGEPKPRRVEGIIVQRVIEFVTVSMADIVERYGKRIKGVPA